MTDWSSIKPFVLKILFTNWNNKTIFQIWDLNIASKTTAKLRFDHFWFQIEILISKKRFKTEEWTIRTLICLFLAHNVLGFAWTASFQ